MVLIPDFSVNMMQNYAIGDRYHHFEINTMVCYY